MSYHRNQDRTEAQRYADQIRQDQRDNASALNGIALGVLAAVAIVAAATAFYFVNRQNETAPTPIVVPSTSPASPQKETIIREEKTRELVPVPQATSEPNVNIIVPSSSPSSATAPAAPDKPVGSSSAQSPAPLESPSAVPSSSPGSAN